MYTFTYIYIFIHIIYIRIYKIYCPCSIAKHDDSHGCPFEIGWLMKKEGLETSPKKQKVS